MSLDCIFWNYFLPSFPHLLFMLPPVWSGFCLQASSEVAPTNQQPLHISKIGTFLFFQVFAAFVRADYTLFRETISYLPSN